MTTRSQPESHLDADQLNAFAEGALPATERALCLQHLAECAHCREIAFLAGASLPSVEHVPAHARRLRFTWWPVLSVGAAALTAVVITAVLLHHTHQSAPPAVVKIAVKATSPSTPPAIPEASINREETRAHSLPKPPRAEKAAPIPKAAALGNRQVNDAAVSDSTTGSAQIAAGASQQLAPGVATLRRAPDVPVAPPLAQPSQTQMGAAAKAAPGVTLRSYNESTLRASDGSAQISGTITDSSGATIPHAKITLDQDAGAAHRETLTDGSGRFTIGSLPPGRYKLEISSPGFTAQVREVELGASQLARVDSQLAAGVASETVEVRAADSALKTESASVQPTLQNQEPPQTSVNHGARTLALDTSGKLFISKNAGTHWKPVHGPWKKSAVTDLSLTADQQFKVTTAQGSWLSGDGEHWHPAN